MLFLWYQYGNLLKNYVKINILLLMGHVLSFSLYALSFCFPLSSILIFLSYCTTTMISVATIFYHRYHFIMTPPPFYENNFWLPKIFQTLSILNRVRCPSSSLAILKFLNWFYNKLKYDMHWGESNWHAFTWIPLSM